jgi:hypothetical protein
MCFQVAGSLSADRPKENDHARIVDVVQPPPTSMTPTMADILLDGFVSLSGRVADRPMFIKKDFRR